MTQLKTQTEWLKASATAKPMGVDKENRRINGMVIALEGVIKGDHDGEFNVKGLREIVKLSKLAPKGMKSRLAHPTASDDGVSSFLGRVTGVHLGEANLDRKGVKSTVAAVRGDLQLADSAFQSDGPHGNMGDYILSRVEEDESAISSSMVLGADKQLRLNKDGSRKLSEETGEPLPPIWIPMELHAFDIVGDGGAVDGLMSLSADGLSDEVLRRGCELLDKQFMGKDREFIEARLAGFVSRYLGQRFNSVETAAHFAGTLRRRQEQIDAESRRR